MEFLLPLKFVYYKGNGKSETLQMVKFLVRYSYFCCIKSTAIHEQYRRKTTKSEKCRVK